MRKQWIPGPYSLGRAWLILSMLIYIYINYIMASKLYIANYIIHCMITISHKLINSPMS